MAFTLKCYAGLLEDDTNRSVDRVGDLLDWGTWSPDEALGKAPHRLGANTLEAFRLANAGFVK